MTHPWKSSGSKRTIWWYHEPSPVVMQYLNDMRDAIRYGVMKSYLHWKSSGDIPSAIDLRKEMKEWFSSHYSYARHHINPVCKSSVAIIRSFKKNHHNKIYPHVKKLSMRLDSDLVKIVGDRLRITIEPGKYEFITINRNNEKWEEYSNHKICEVLITDRIVAISFTVKGEKTIGEDLIGTDLNFKSVDVTSINTHSKGIEEVSSIPISKIAGIQNSFSKRRSNLQKQIKNRKKRNRIKDAMHKLSAQLVKDHPDASFVFENLTGIKKKSKSKSNKMRTYLNRWPYSQFQKMVEYKSHNKTMCVNPGGTSSRCPVCGGRLKHPTLKVSRCKYCGRDYDRDRLASLAISLRGLHLCGEPFPVSAMASLPSMMDDDMDPSNLDNFFGSFEEIVSMQHCYSMKMYSKRRNHSIEIGYEG